jgi:hypothetical protein
MLDAGVGTRLQPMPQKIAAQRVFLFNAGYDGEL